MYVKEGNNGIKFYAKQAMHRFLIQDIEKRWKYFVVCGEML